VNSGTIGEVNTNDNQAFITFNTWGSGISGSREVMRINQRGTLWVPSCRIGVQDNQDGGPGRGIYLWSTADAGWGIYMGQSGASKSLAGGTACAGSGFTQHAVRIRVGNSVNQGFIFENAAETCLASIRGSDGLAFFNNSITMPTSGSRGLYWGNGSAAIGYATNNNDWATGSLSGHVVIRGQTGVFVQQGSATPNFMIDGSNRVRANMIRSIAGNLGLSSQWSVSADQVQLNANGLNYQQNNTSAWAVSSDRRIKENIQIADYDRCYSNIQKLELHRFNYSSNFRTFEDRNQLGFIAQEVQEICPKAIAYTSNEMLDGTVIPDLMSIQVDQINLMLYGAVKKLQQIIEDTNNRITELESLLAQAYASDKLLNK
jgi:hypothetical protein